MLYICLQFDVVTPSTSFDLRLNVPINIGTIPLHDIPAQPVPGPSTVQSIAPPLTGPNASGPPYPNAPALPQSNTAGPSNFVGKFLAFLALKSALIACNTMKVPHQVKVTKNFVGFFISWFYDDFATSH